MNKSEAMRILNMLHPVYGGFDKNKNAERVGVYGKILLPLDFVTMQKAVDELFTADIEYPKPYDLIDAYDAQKLKEKMQKKAEKEKALKEINKGDYQVNCLVCLDHGIVYYDKWVNVNGHKTLCCYSAHCDQCEEGNKHRLKFSQKDSKGRAINTEWIGKGISEVLDINSLTEQNLSGLKGLKSQPNVVYSKIIQKQPSDKAMARGKELLRAVGLGHLEII